MGIYYNPFCKFYLFCNECFSQYIAKCNLFILEMKKRNFVFLGNTRWQFSQFAWQIKTRYWVTRSFHPHIAHITFPPYLHMHWNKLCSVQVEDRMLSRTVDFVSFFLLHLLRKIINFNLPWNNYLFICLNWCFRPLPLNMLPGRIHWWPLYQCFCLLL